MKTATVKQLKDELKGATNARLIELCLHLSKFKKENKELLTYLLFEAADEETFILGVQEEISTAFQEINTSSYYFIKKSVRKILRLTKKYIRYSKKKETEVALLLHFCKELKAMKPSYKRNTSLVNIFERQFLMIQKVLLLLHEDLQYDYGIEFEKLFK